MSIEIVFETHALSEDNERGIATGWLPGRLCERGRANAADMGRRRRGDGLAAVFSSDLRRAAQTARIAFGDTDIPILYDWRLRECDFGARNGSPAAEVKSDRLDYCDRPYPGGESHEQAIARVARCLADLPTRGCPVDLGRASRGPFVRWQGGGAPAYRCCMRACRQRSQRANGSGAAGRDPQDTP